MVELWYSLRIRKMSTLSEYDGLEMFLRDVYENEVEISRLRSENEARDIIDAVNRVTEELLFKAFENDRIFRIPREEISDHLFLVGGVAERSKINDLDEFDFTFKFPHFKKGTIEVLGRENDRVLNSSPFRQIKYKGPRDIKRKLLNRCLLAKINSDVYLSAFDLSNFFEKRINGCMRKFFFGEKLEVKKSTGYLALSQTDFEKHGPALTLYFRWKNNDDTELDRKGLHISVDIAATVMSDDESLLDGVTAANEYKEILSKVRFGNLIPFKFEHSFDTEMYLVLGRNKYILKSVEDLIVRCTFRISFVQSEMKILEKIENEHSGWFECYRLLKFFSESHALYMYNETHFNDPKYDRIFGKNTQIYKFSSYVLKTLVFTKRNEFSHLELESIAPKFMVIFDEILDILKQHYDKPLDVGYDCVPSIWFDDLSAMNTIIPQTEENERQREEKFQKEHVLRQLARFDSIKRLLLQINSDENYTYAKYRDILVKECVNLHADLLKRLDRSQI